MNFKLNNVEVERKTKTVYSEDGMTIKLFVEDYPVSKVLNEALNLSKVEEGTDLLIPKLMEVEKVDNRWALVTEYIEGTPLDKLMKKYPEREDKYLKFMAQVQIYVLSKTVPMLPNLKEKYTRKIKESTELSENNKYELLQRLSGMNEHTNLCHGDFNPSNIIIKSDGSYAIIDWAHATQGNVAADVAKTYLTFATHDKKDLAEKYLELFSNMSNIDKEYIQKWVPIVAAAYLDQENEEKDLLKTWANIVDFE